MEENEPSFLLCSQEATVAKYTLPNLVWFVKNHRVFIVSLPPLNRTG